MILADVLPVWLQWATDLAQILSAVGVIIAFVQLRAASKQFHEQLQISTDQFQTQLKLTQDQFKILNQGFLKLTMTQLFITNSNGEADPSKRIPLDPKSAYSAGRVQITLENVGNLPVRVFFRHFTVNFSTGDYYNSPDSVLELCSDIVHPKTKNDFYVATFPFNQEGTPLNLAGIAELRMTYKFLIEYYDYNDTDKKIKTIERDAKFEENLIFSTHIYDKL